MDEGVLRRKLENSNSKMYGMLEVVHEELPAMIEQIRQGKDVTGSLAAMEKVIGRLLEEEKN